MADNNSGDPGPDLKGERGGSTGNTKQKGKGEQAEKGDQRREKMHNEDKSPSRPGGAHGRASDSGSHSNEEAKN